MGDLSCCCENSESTSEDFSASLSSVDAHSLPPIVFFDCEVLKRLGKTPRSPEDKGLQITFNEIDREKSLFIFVSHCWLRGYPGAQGYDGRPHPDTANHDKLQLIFKAISHIKKGLISTSITHIFLWLDYGCIDQDASACLELKMLDKIIQVCVFNGTMSYIVQVLLIYLTSTAAQHGTKVIMPISIAPGAVLKCFTRPIFR